MAFYYMNNLSSTYFVDIAHVKKLNTDLRLLSYFIGKAEVHGFVWKISRLYNGALRTEITCILCILVLAIKSSELAHLGILYR